MIQGLLVLDNTDYVPKNWHGTLLVIAITAFCIIFNTFLAKKLPMVEGMVLIIHLLGFFAVLVPLWVLAPRSSPKAVFTEFSNFGGWSSTGLSFMVGLLAPVYTLIGADSAVHMSEEIKDASVVLPRAIMWAATINGTMGWIMVITFCFTLGNVGDILSSPTGYPFIQVFFNVTKSNVGTSIMTAILIVNITSACISTVATVSRQTWSFARDRGLPFSDFISQVSIRLGRKEKWLLNNIAGQTRLEHSTERRHSHLHHHNTSVAHQHRLKRRLQRHRFPCCLSTSSYLHHIFHMPYSTSSEGRSPIFSLDVRTCWASCKYWCRRIPARGLDLYFLPSSHACDSYEHELERGHVLWYYDFRCCVLFLQGKIQLYLTS